MTKDTAIQGNLTPAPPVLYHTTRNNNSYCYHDDD